MSIALAYEPPPLRFFDLYMMNLAEEEDADAHIEQWEASDRSEDIYEFLGMTFSEYARWSTGIPLVQVAAERRAAE